MADLLKIANVYGNVDVRLGTPKGYEHVRGERLQPLCRKLGIRYAQALVRWGGTKRYPRPVFDGVVVSKRSTAKLKAAIDERKLRVATKNQRVLRKTEKLRAERREQRRAEFRNRFPAASEETIAACCDSPRSVYASLEDVPLAALTHQEIDDFRLKKGREVGVLLVDAGATSVPLFEAHLPDDVSPTPQASAIHRIAVDRGVSPQRALWLLNKLAKVVSPSPKRQVYSLKDRLLSLWSDFLIDGRVSRTESRPCWGCDGTGEHWSGDLCDRCDGTGCYSSRTLYEVRYSFPGDDRTYCFHTFTKPRLLSEEAGADRPSYGVRLRTEDIKNLPFGFHDLLRIVSHEVSLRESAETAPHTASNT